MAKLKFIGARAFKKWLQERPDNWTGYCGDPRRCPLAQATGYRISGYIYGALPNWAVKFVKGVDMFDTVTKEQALRILIRNAKV